MEIDKSQYVGKTLTEVKKLHKNVRVTSAGPVSFYGTADYRLDRLNVKLSEENLKFGTETFKIGPETFTTPTVEGEMDEGIVVDCYFG